MWRYLVSYSDLPSYRREERFYRKVPTPRLPPAAANRGIA
jgi:hypothetical protein